MSTAPNQELRVEMKDGVVTYKKPIVFVTDNSQEPAIVEIPADFPPLPEPPAGHHWVPRGWGWSSAGPVRYTITQKSKQWHQTNIFPMPTGGNPTCFYLEAVPNTDQREEVVKLEAENLDLISERDRLEDIADNLAARIADYFGEDIGEHSNLNNPWDNAIDILGEHRDDLGEAIKRAEKFEADKHELLEALSYLSNYCGAPTRPGDAVAKANAVLAKHGH